MADYGLDTTREGAGLNYCGLRKNARDLRRSLKKKRDKKAPLQDNTDRRGQIILQRAPRVPLVADAGTARAGVVEVGEVAHGRRAGAREGPRRHRDVFSGFALAGAIGIVEHASI